MVRTQLYIHQSATVDCAVQNTIIMKLAFVRTFLNLYKSFTLNEHINISIQVSGLLKTLDRNFILKMLNHRLSWVDNSIV